MVKRLIRALRRQSVVTSSTELERFLRECGLSTWGNPAEVHQREELLRWRGVA
jgi:hypothetical protein